MSQDTAKRECRTALELTSALLPRVEQVVNLTCEAGEAGDGTVTTTVKNRS